ncbi:MAG: hypothetical protein AAF722_09740 [Cyanobacteria bacterium P01_C01_bin.70]
MNKLAVIGISVGAVAIGLYTGVGIYTSKAAEARLDKLIAEVDDEVDIEYGSAKVNLLGSSLTVKDISVATKDAPEQPILINKIVVNEFDDQSDFPTVFDASVKGIQVSDSQNTAALTPFLAQAGYQDAPELDLDTRYEYDETTGEMTLEEFRLGADDLGHFEVTFTLGNFDPEATANDELTLHALEIVYEDDSFVENLLTAMAEQSNQEVEQFKTQLTSGLSQNAQFFVPMDNPVAITALQEAVAFIENPNGFSISAKPQQPVLVSDLSSASNQDWMTMLNLEIKAY